jgi:hypothetical protein
MEPNVKIEIGESLIHSWLRHVQGCTVTQMSWKPSPTWTMARERELKEAFEVIRKFASETIGIQIFKNGDFSQFLRQAEVDVLGVRWSRPTAAPSVIAVDSAFHEYGLQYGNTDETVGRVLKKLIRAAFALEAYLDVDEASIVFATPKMAEPIRETVQRHLATLEMRLADQRGSAMPRLRFRVIANTEFSNEIVAPVLEQVDLVADTSELFMRAQQLMRLCDPGPGNRPSSASVDRPASTTTDEGSRIGEHVRTTMAALAASGRLTARIVGDLLDHRYCKAKFNLGLAFLKPVDQRIPLSRQRIDSNGYGRYWKHPLRIGDHEFLMCCQWFVWQRKAFDAWVRDIGGSPAPTAPDTRFLTDHCW